MPIQIQISMTIKIVGCSCPPESLRTPESATGWPNSGIVSSNREQKRQGCGGSTFKDTTVLVSGQVEAVSRHCVDTLPESTPIEENWYCWWWSYIWECCHRTNGNTDGSQLPSITRKWWRTLWNNVGTKIPEYGRGPNKWSMEATHRRNGQLHCQHH